MENSNNVVVGSVSGHKLLQESSTFWSIVDADGNVLTQVSQASFEAPVPYKIVKELAYHEFFLACGLA